MTAAREIIEKLELMKHPEGGWYRQTFEDENPGGRAFSTAILFLLESGDRSNWHRVDAAEAWHYYAGAPVTLTLSPDGKQTEDFVLGPDVLKGEMPQLVVPKGCWQSAVSQGEWTLMGCTVAPGFRFAGFDMAPPGWQPG